jgi:cytochrome c biogenesis protein CcmG/thiol:disulfide interchange protein DsbE
VKRWFAVIPLVALVALAVLFVGWSLRREPEYRPDAMVGQPLPATSLPVLTGAVPGPRTASLAEVAQGRPVVVNLFASWCAPCRIEHPQLMAMRDQGITVIGVAYKDDPAETRAFLDELGDPFEVVLVDREGRAGLDLGVSGVPETFVVGADGTIVTKLAGPIIEAGEARRLSQAALTAR